jgi:branched-chain amino acid transport system substrate-binding protein
MKPDPNTLSRREFLRLAGVAGVAVGGVSGLGALVGACGGTQETTTTASPATTAGATSTTAPPASSTTEGATTTVSATVETAREIKIGFPSPQTGAIATFGVPDKYCVDRWKESIKDGVVCGDGKMHPITFIVKDTQSDPNRTSQVAGDLIQNDKVDVMVVASSPDTVNPTADQCEANGVPCLSDDCPMESFWVSRGKDPAKDTFKWTYNFFWTLEDQSNVYMDMWNKTATNKVIGVMFPNDADGNGDRTVWPDMLKGGGYKMIDGGAYQDGTEDYTSQVSMFKKAGCDLVAGDMIPPDFVNFWKQCIQQGFRPKVASIMKALLFPEAVEAAGTGAYGLTGDGWWMPSWPFKSSLSGETCQQLADDFEAKQKRQWTQPVGHYVLGEWVVDVLKRTKDVETKQSYVDAILATNIPETIRGPINFADPVKAGTRHQYLNGYNAPFVGGQWIKGTKYPFDFVVCDNVSAPNITPVQPLAPLTYTV